MADLGLRESVIVLTGGNNTGKTWGASTYLPPSRVDKVFYHDGEGSTNRFVEQLGRRGLSYGHRVNLDARWKDLDLPGTADLLKRIRRGSLPWVNEGQRNSMEDYWEFVLKDIDENMTPGDFSVYVHDPVGRLESGIQAYVEGHRKETGWRRKAYGEMWTAGYYPLYRGLINAIFDRGVRTIIFTAHLGNPWTDEGPIPGKVRPKAKPELYKLAQFYVWLVNEPSNKDGAPAGVVLKERLGVVDVDSDDEWSLSRRIPRRIPHFTWDDVADYLENGCDLADPAPGEVPTAQEQEMIDDALSEKQMQLMLLRAKKSLAEEAGEALINTEGSFDLGDLDPKQLARKLYGDGEGVSLKQIAEEVGKPLPLVRRWVED